MFSPLAAPTSKGLPRQRVDVALYQIYPHIHEQNPMSCECGHGSSFGLVQVYLCPLIDVPPSGRQKVAAY